tara:strand:- start:30 stop:425 length:396 start_codon:yes stop_codon:yes gene_type:complete
MNLLKMSLTWQARWGLCGITPYYYFYPNQLDGENGVLRSDVPLVSLLGWVSMFLWGFFLLSFIGWWWILWDWLIIVWIICISFICVEWICLGCFMQYENKEAMEKNNNNNNNMDPIPTKNTKELKSLKMQL